MIEFEWDATKNTANRDKHGINFKDITQLFEEPYLKKRDTRKDYGEERMIAIGSVKERIITVVYTVRNNKVRIISARKANQPERRSYDNFITNPAD